MTDKDALIRQLVDLEHRPIPLDDGQRGWVERFEAAPPLSATVWEIARQRGKSYAALAIAVRLARVLPNGIARYCALTKESAQTLTQPILSQLFDGWRPAERPRLSSITNEDGLPGPRVLTWPNGFQLFIFGTDAQSFRKGRGPKTHLQILDEAAFYQNLESVEAALLPALQTTGGKVLYLSTPPESAGHPFADRARAARGQGRFEHDTFYGNPRIDHDSIIREEAGRLGMTREQFVASTYFRREFQAEEVVEEAVVALPAWQGVKDWSVQEWLRPEFYDGYASVDWGGVVGDPHAGLFGYLDFTASTLVIEYEFERRTGDLDELAREWKALEKLAWGTTLWDGKLLGAGEFERLSKPLPDYLKKVVSDTAPRQPYLRVSDWDDNLQSELLRKHGYALLPARKDSKHLQVDELNTLIRLRRLVVHPRCVRLIEQLSTTTWDKSRTEWVRTSKDHGDLVDCLVYMARHVQWHRDPRPKLPQTWWKQETRPEWQPGVGRIKRY